MDTQQVKQTIEQQKDRLRALGLVRVGIYGSVARGEAHANSDIDLVLDFDPKQKTYRNFYQSTTLIESILHQPVDAVTPQGLSPYVKPSVQQDITYVQITQ